MINTNFLEKLESFFGKMKDWGILRHILKIPNMLLHPRRFWMDYNLMSTQDKFIQFTTYGALFALAIWLVSYESLSIVDLIKIIAMEIAALFVYVVIISLANVIVKREWSNLWFFVVFCCYTKFICLIPALLALRSYYETETPLLMSLSILISMVAELIILIYSSYVCQKTKRKVFGAILLSVFILNIYDSVFIITDLPRPISTNYENSIIKERFELGKSIKNAYEIPTYVLSWEKSGDICYLYSNPTDTIASRKFDDTERFFEDLAEDIDSLKVITKRCKFNTNKKFFDEMYSLKKGIKYVHDTKSYKYSPILKQKDVMLDSIVVDRLYYREFNKELKEINDKLLIQEVKEAEQFAMAYSINNFGALWHPVLFINWLKKIKTNENCTESRNDCRFGCD